mgnify:CR=1 FL=1
MKVLLVIVILWLVGNFMYEVAPAVREGYSWARSNLHNLRFICTVGVVMFVGAYVWGQVQLRMPSARAWRSVFPSRRYPVTSTAKPCAC